MNAIIRINEFKRVLAESRYVVKGKTEIPIHEYVKVDVYDANRATISARNDFGTCIVQTFEVVDGEIGSFLLPAKQTHEFLKGHVDGTATIEATSDNRT